MGLILDKEDLDKLDCEGELSIDLNFFDFITDIHACREIQEMINDYPELKVGEEITLSADRDTKVRVVEVDIPRVKIVFKKAD